MANADNFYIGANDEHGQFPPTVGKRTPIMPYIGRSFYENEFNRPAKYYFLLACLRTGFNVYDVKPELTDLSISQRVTRINRQGLSRLVTFAYNAAADSSTFSSANGYAVYYSRENYYSTLSRLLAYDVSAGLSEEIPLRNLGVGTLTEIGVLRSVNCPAVIAECGFMTNFNEAKLMVDPDFQESCGDGACIGVSEDLDVSYVPQIYYTSLPTLRRGSRGKSVQILQCYLNLYGEELTVDGAFGSGTEAAVREFQTQNGLAADGIVGRNTWAYLTRQMPLPTLRRGSRGVFVRYLQQKLLSKLYPVGNIDGVFGGATQTAVEQFQEENGLDRDGIVGRMTWSRLTPLGGGRPLP
ncbi:MAG: peptidoglycan-binding protein [Clostridia bacterium]|nr:peptidoglycan-binding protein [Clostridia bacterium]